MKILIIEDEARIARRLERMTRAFFGERLSDIAVCDSLQKGLSHLSANQTDLLLLDLNLNGENGFDVLETFVAGSFHTIIVSANTDKAITAFSYGVLDFVPKPFDEPRLAQAFKRLSADAAKNTNEISYMAVKKAGHIQLIPVEDIEFIKGAGIYTELHLIKGKTALHDKSLESLEQLLPDRFHRIHKSYIVPLHRAEKIIVDPGGKYQLLLKNGEALPVGRSRYKELKEKMI
jgi:two-component system response regulator LytT